MAMGYTGRILLAFVALLVGVLLLSNVSTETQGATTKSSVVNESIALVALATQVNETHVYTLANLGDTSVDCPITNFVLSNSTDDAWTSGVDYTFTASSGTYTLTNTSETWLEATVANQTYADYTYCDAGYMNLGWGRTMLNLAPGFFALALLFVSVALFYGIYRDTFGK